MKICCVVGAGECESFDFEKKSGDIIIAADGGYKVLKSSGIQPDYVVGDFDSLGYVPDEENVIRFKPEKDFTDMYSSVEKGIELGFENFVIYGATGGREDHTLANYQLIASLAERGFNAVLINGCGRVTAIHNSSKSFSDKYEGFISVFSHSDISEGVTLEGLKYPLDDVILKNTFALGVSNEFSGKESRVTVKNGTLIIMYNE